MKVLARGKLGDEAEQALNYAFSFPYAQAVSVGIRNLRELKTAIEAEKVQL